MRVFQSKPRAVVNVVALGAMFIPGAAPVALTVRSLGAGWTLGNGVCVAIEGVLQHRKAVKAPNPKFEKFVFSGWPGAEALNAHLDRIKPADA